MIRLREFLRCDRGSSAAEFTLVLPLFLFILLGTIELGRFAWEVNRVEKAVQIGARWAVATDLIPGGLKDYSFATTGGLPQGSVVPKNEFPDVICKGTSGGASCQCAGSCKFGTTADQLAFINLLKRMNQVYSGQEKPAAVAGRIKPENLQVTYSWSGLGFAGDPNGPDVVPLTKVTLKDMKFRTLALFGASIDLPAFSYSLTLEDGDGTSSN